MDLKGAQGRAPGGLAVGHRSRVGERGTQRRGAKNITAKNSAALNSTVTNRTAEGGAAVQGGPKDGAEEGGGYKNITVSIFVILRLYLFSSLNVN